MSAGTLKGTLPPALASTEYTCQSALTVKWLVRVFLFLYYMSLWDVKLFSYQKNHLHRARVPIPCIQLACHRVPNKNRRDTHGGERVHVKWAESARGCITTMGGKGAVVRGGDRSWACASKPTTPHPRLFDGLSVVSSR